MPRFSIEKLFSQSIEVLRRGNLLCSTKILVSKKIMDKSEGGGEGGREGLSRFSVRNFCLTVFKKFVEDSFRVRQKLWYRKMVGIRGGASITIFRRIVLSHSSESSRRGILLCFRMSRVPKKLFLRGEYHDFL